MKRVLNYFDNEGLHTIVFNADGSIFEHWLKPSEKITNEDIARVHLSASLKSSGEKTQ